MTTPRSLFSLIPAKLSVLCLLIVFSCLGGNNFSIVPSAAAASSAPEKLKPADRYALIFGTVWGPDDHPVYGVKVRIRTVGHKHAHWELTSDHVGEFAQRVPAATADYEVWADLNGVKTKAGEKLHLAQKVAVHVEYDERVDIGLHLTR